MNSSEATDAVRSADQATAVHRVIVLLFVNPGLSVVLAVLMFVFRDGVIDYQPAHTSVPPGTDPSTVRAVLENTVWVRVGTVLLVTLVYVFLVRRLLGGQRRAYLRVLFISVVGLLAIGYVIMAGGDPVRMRVEQGLQAVVLAVLLWSVTRPELRAAFAKPTGLPGAAGAAVAPGQVSSSGRVALRT